jgi:hypothetical protein
MVRPVFAPARIEPLLQTVPMQAPAQDRSALAVEERLRRRARGGSRRFRQFGDDLVAFAQLVDVLEAVGAASDRYAVKRIEWMPCGWSAWR